MTKQTRFFALGLLVAGTLAGGSIQSGASASATAIAPLAGDARAGKTTFTVYCSICHGVNATGFIGPRIAGINWTAPGLQSIVRGGLGGYGGMPAFNADVVTDQNIADIAAYLAPATPALAASAASPAAAEPGSQTAESPGGDPVHGSQVYSANCAACHGARGQGGFGPSLIGEKTRKDAAAAIAWIKNPKPPMPKLYPAPLGEKDVEDVAAYIESL